MKKHIHLLTEVSWVHVPCSMENRNVGAEDGDNPLWVGGGVGIL